MNDDTPTRRAVPDDNFPHRGLSAGQRIFGRYTLEAVAGRGGMGVVWRAKDEELGESVALKFLPEIVAGDTVAMDELKEETRRARRLTHPHIVHTYGFERDDTNAAVSMEFVDGTTLAQMRLAQPDKVFSTEKLAPLVAQLCAALDYAHNEAKVVHRDLKPANLLATGEGQLKVTDFGIARSLSETHTRLTGKGTGTSGTLLYMSPQQLTGGPATPADDIYSLGVTLYELLTGKPPFYTGDITHQILHKFPASLMEQRTGLGLPSPAIPRQWEKIILQCLDKDAARRPKNANEIARQLSLSGKGTPASVNPAARGSEPKARPLSSIRYPAGGGKWEDLEEPVVSSVHYPNPDRKNKSGPQRWFDYLVILGLITAGVVYFMGLTPVPRPWIEASPALEPEAPATATATPSRLPREKIEPPASTVKTVTETNSAGPAQNIVLPATGFAQEPAAMASSLHTPAVSPAASTTPEDATPAVRHPVDPSGTATPIAPPAGAVRLAVLPANSSAYLDDSPVSLTVPLNLPQISPGHHILRLRAPGYQEKRIEFAVEAGQPLDLGTERLVAGSGSLVIDSQPSFVQFVLKDETGKSYRGVTPWDDNKLPVGAYTLTFTRSGIANAVKIFTLEDHALLRVMADFSGGSVNISALGSAVIQSKPAMANPPSVSVIAPKSGRLMLDVIGPSDYQLYANGRLIERPARGPGGVELPTTGELSLELKAPGYQTATRQLTLGPGVNEVWRVALEPLPRQEWNQAEPIGLNLPSNPAPASRPGQAADAVRSVVPPAVTAPPVQSKEMPRLLESVQPVYPSSVQAGRIQGTVIVRLMIQANGRVGNVEEISSPDPRLTKAVREAVAQFRFAPAKINGQPVPMQVTMEFEFKL